MPFIMIIIALFIVGLLFTYYTYHILLLLPEIKHRKKIAAGIVFVLLVCMYFFRLIMGFMVNVCFVFILFDLISLLVSRSDKTKKYWRIIYQRGITGLVIALVISIYGVYNASHVEIKEYMIEVSKDIVDKKVLMATDMHISTAIGKKELDTFSKTVKEQDPDLILLVGDIYDESSTKSDIEYSYKIFESLSKEYPIYFVSGNHEVGHGVGGVLDDLAITKKFPKIGITFIKDAVVELEDMYLIGRQDASIKERKELSDLTSGLNSDKMLLVMDHQPKEYAENKRLGVDLQVSGHTHGGQLFPIGVLDSLFHINEMNYGYKDMGSFQAVVSSGMGTWGFAMRTSQHCEIVMLHIKSKN